MSTQTFNNGETGLNIRNKLNSFISWNPTYSYQFEDICHVGGTMFYSLINDNIGNPPGITSSVWRTTFLSSSFVASSSVAVSSSWSTNSISSSYALNVGSIVLTTGSTQPITSSWSLNSISSSYSPMVSGVTNGGSYNISSSFASSSISSSFSRNSLSSSYCISGSYFNYVSYNVTQSLSLINSSSWASSSLYSRINLSSSYASSSTTSDMSTTSSYSLSSFSSSYSTLSSTSSYSLNAGQFVLSTGSKYPITASWSDNVITSSYISGSLQINGVTGYYPKYYSSSLSDISSIYEDGSGIRINVPVFITASVALTASRMSGGVEITGSTDTQKLAEVINILRQFGMII